MGGTALIAAEKCVGGEGEGDVCVGVGVIVWVGVGMIAWVRKGVCGWDSLDCCHKVCVGGEGEVCV